MLILYMVVPVAWGDGLGAHCEGETCPSLFPSTLPAQGAPRPWVLTKGPEDGVELPAPAATAEGLEASSAGV